MTVSTNPVVDEAVTEPQRRPRRSSAEAAFRARVDERLRGLEEEMDEIKGRLNGLLFFIASTILAQLILKLAS